MLGTQQNRFAVGQRLRPWSFRASTSRPEPSPLLAPPPSAGNPVLTTPLHAPLRSLIMKAAD